ncbi:MAG TPA: SpoIID/LytB domain-containing protein [Bryobacteraceae bacterium]|nr:SpoIID/LytB domain-containing protein [Bryobacteraceae bacterium]
MTASRLLAIVVASVLPGAAGEIRIHVLGLFRAKEIAVRESRIAGEFTLVIPGRIERTYRGKLAIKQDGGIAQATVDVDIEDAVAGVVAAEMPGSSPPEALRALAVAARSYYVSSPKRHTGFDYCDTTHCQFYRGPVDRSSAGAAAARTTRGLILRAGTRPVGVLYSARCGGRTEASAGTDRAGEGYAYQAVDCAECLRGAAPIREGHGVGLCQRGAIGMAKRGADFREILMHYFPGIRFGI